MGRMTPLGAATRGIAAGLVGSAALGMFLMKTGKVAPEPPKEAFQPPEEAQKSEQPTETVARRTVEDFMKLGPLSKDAKARGGELVHFGFGGAWGALYGMLHETVPGMCGPLAAAAFGAFVWTASDHVILPAFRLAPLPTKLPLKFHAYWLSAHVLYGLTTWASFEAMRPQAIPELLAAGYGMVRRKKILDRIFARLEPVTDVLLPRVNGLASRIADATA